jgi:hypothetical protein
MADKAQLLGVTRFKDTIDGRSYDTTKLLVVLPFDPNNQDRAGFDTVSYNYGTSANFEKFKGRQYPIEVMLTKSEVATTRGASIIVTNCEFLPINQPQQK